MVHIPQVIAGLDEHGREYCQGVCAALVNKRQPSTRALSRVSKHFTPKSRLKLACLKTTLAQISSEARMSTVRSYKHTRRDVVIVISITISSALYLISLFDFRLGHVGVT